MADGAAPALRVGGPRDGVLELRLDRPQRLNALTHGLAQALLQAVQAAGTDSAVRVLLLSGEGRAFCAGKDRDEPGSADFVATLQQLGAALMASPLPVVAAVQGWAVGAGLELLLTCDLVVAERQARLQLPEVSLGLFGTGGVYALLPQKVGLAKAKGALLLGQPFSAEDAERWGLIWAVADDEAALRAQALAICTHLAATDPRSLGTIKQLLHAEAVGDFQAVLARESQAHQRLE